jgi:hypothetical protein
MRILSYLIVLSFIINNGCQNSENRNQTSENKTDTVQIGKNDLLSLNLNGNVKTIHDTTFNATDKSGAIVKGSVVSVSYMLFNEKGNLAEDSDGTGEKYNTRSLHKIDEKGLRTESFLYRNNKLNFRYTYKYDAEGNKIECGGYKPEDSTLFTKQTYKYNPGGNLIEECFYLSDGKLSSKIIYQYDDKGNIAEEKTYGSDSKIMAVLRNKYNDKGNITESCFFDAQNNPGSKYNYRYKYDEQNNWREMTIYNNDTLSAIKVRAIKYR